MAATTMEVATMAPGDRVEIVAAPRWAFGAGAEPHVPADATVVFELELESFNDWAKDLAPYISHRFPITQTKEALTTMAERTPSQDDAMRERLMGCLEEEIDCKRSNDDGTQQHKVRHF